MGYFIGDLTDATGVAPRTIREYIRRGMMKPPRGHGLAAEYDDEHLARLTTIARMRAKGAGLDGIKARTARWSKAKFDEFVAATDPQPELPQQEPVASAPPPAEPALPHEEPPAALPPKRERADRIERDGVHDEALPEGPRFVLAALLPGLALMVGADASPLVRRVAAEICARYGAAKRE